MWARGNTSVCAVDKFGKVSGLDKAQALQQLTPLAGIIALPPQPLAAAMAAG